MFSTSTSNSGNFDIDLSVTFLNFEIGSRSNYLVSMIALSGMKGSFQKITGIFSTSISQRSLMLN